MEEWKEYKLEDLCIKITDGSHFSPQACQTGYPMFSVKDMLEYGFDYSNCKYISEKDFESMKNGGCIPQKGDILVAKDGSFLKQIFECKETKEEAILSSIAIFRPNQNIVTPTFLCYLLKSPKIYNYIALNCVTGSALPRIVLKDFKKVSMQVSSLPTQQKIAAILSSLDDKIELNNRINTNLEQQAQALFKNWFVDFEPFGGEMPEGWKVGKLSDIAEIKTDTFKPEQNPDIQVEHYSLPAFDEKRYPTFEISKELKSNKFIISNDEVLVSKLNPTVKRVWRPYCLTEKSICSTEFIVYKPISAEFKDYLFSIVNSSEFNDFMCSNVTGSTNSHQRTPPKTTLNYEITIPTKEILHKFCNIVTPMYDKINENIKQNETVSSLRDTLLPKLMNGEIEV